MPVVYKEIVPEKLIKEKPRPRADVDRYGPRLAHTLNDEVKRWVHENIKNHWFLTTNGSNDKHNERQFWYRSRTCIIINFTNENDAIAFKLAWL